MIKIKLKEEVTYVKPGMRKLLTPEELFLKDSQNRQLVEPCKSKLTKTVQLVMSQIWG